MGSSLAFAVSAVPAPFAGAAGATVAAGASDWPCGARSQAARPAPATSKAINNRNPPDCLEFIVE
jgi:hypothetical protein